MLNNILQKLKDAKINNEFNLSLSKEEGLILGQYLCENNYANYSDLYRQIVESNDEILTINFFESGDLSLN